MKNLLQINGPYIEWFEKIVLAKHNPRKNRLNGFQPTVEERYAHYEEMFLGNALLEITDSVLMGEQKTDLVHCYEGETAPLSELIVAIKNAQERDLRGTCQYCGVFKPTTTDHYLPKTNYPEYSVLAINLFPCCPICNGKKGDYWKDDENRGIINFYLDTLPHERFLFVDLHYDEGDPIPSVYFSIQNDGAITADLFEVIEKHFNRLVLLEHYVEYSAEEISNTIDTLVDCNVAEGDIQASLHRMADTLFDKSGFNNWKAVLMEALANSDDFIQRVISEQVLRALL